MVQEIPQWLTHAYVRSTRAAGAERTKEELAAACADLVARWQSPERHYHALSHVSDLLSRLESLIEETHEPALVRLAAWYHGIVFSTVEEDEYTRRGGEHINESASFAMQHLTSLGVPGEKAGRVAHLIRALRSSEPRSVTETSMMTAIDIDELALRDAHLGSLADEPQRYKRYLELLKAEYSHLRPEDFYLARRNVVEHLLARKPLFCTPLASAWETRARQNLVAELERITALLARLDADTKAESAPDTEEDQASALAPHVADAEASFSDAEAVDVSLAPAHVESARSVTSTTPEPRVDHGETAPKAALTSEDAITPTQIEPTSRVPSAASPETTTSTMEIPPVPTRRSIADRMASEEASSTMELCMHVADPGVPVRVPSTLEERKRRKREEVAEQTRRAIEEKQKAADAARKSTEAAEAPRV